MKNKKFLLGSIVAIALIIVAVVYVSTQNQKEDFYAKYDIEEQDLKKLVSLLENKLDEKAGLNVSVKPNAVIFSDENEETSRSIKDEFYLSIAPYINQTHDCFYHNLISCRGELVNTKMHVKIVDEKENIIFDKDITTYENGFYGFWLEKDMEGKIEVTYDDKTVSSKITTNEDAPTCLTTLHLE